jgi:hypothetical protein
MVKTGGIPVEGNGRDNISLVSWEGMMVYPPETCTKKPTWANELMLLSIINNDKKNNFIKCFVEFPLPKYKKLLNEHHRKHRDRKTSID